MLTKAELKTRLNNTLHWQDKAESVILEEEKLVSEMLATLRPVYARTAKRIERELNAFYGKYATSNGLTFEDALLPLSKKEQLEFNVLVGEFLAIAERQPKSIQDPVYIHRLQRIQRRTTVSRLDELQTIINYEIEVLFWEQQTQFKKHLLTAYKSSYYKTVFNIYSAIGIGKTVEQLNDIDVYRSIKKKWLGDNYSTRLLKHKDNFKRTIDTKVQQGLINGDKPKKIAKDLTSLTTKRTTPLKTQYNNAVRLANTEFNKVSNQAVKAAYKETKVSEYKILATLDNVTSDICQIMDGKVFQLGQEEVGINYPPFHPNCRTTVIPHFSEGAINMLFEERTRLARYHVKGGYHYVPSSMTFDEWKHRKVV